MCDTDTRERRTDIPERRAGTTPGPAGTVSSTDSPGPAGPLGPLGHTASTVERGSFCLARCSCGWSGPARRARDRARTDARAHAAAAAESDTATP
ncbi:hypothetical protein [Streptomyces sp. NRRL F-5135]|uniref:hypothetical protein n=1 Tax=Streptomyces sp. NRRL F-5135 TaxID=1463858 RepID=UPI000A88C48A|nr:hypothetical protein [Streptomyces sp. NRRL F-5135]